ncbi:MAG TPA: TlpA disulfide reductase family protein [Thermoleophilia bacterium]|nr:TlpA disulfide reductase family protein [Thermoleophilia bacterium]
MVVPAPIRIAAVVSALAGSVSLAGCSASVSGGGGNTGFVDEGVGVTAIAASQRVAAPKLTGTTLDGQKFSLDQDKGDVVVINVWGSWCAPCREETAALEETYQKYQARGVKLLGINTRDITSAAVAFDRSMNVTYPSLQDPDETLLLQFKSMLPAADIPSSVIVDRNGKVAVRVIGAVTEPQLAQQLDAVLSKG